MSDRPLVGVGVLVFDQSGRVLIGRRSKRGEPETWCLPGGHLEAGEPFEQAALRETLEESGMTAVEPRVFAIGVKLAGSGVTVGVVAKADSGQVPVPEAGVFTHWQWFDIKQLPQPLYPASAMLFDAWLARAAGPAWSVYMVPPQ